MDRSFRSDLPIYSQLVDRIKQDIVSGALPPGEKLPSVRELAMQLTINPNTIQRAYRELESEGYIVSVPGKGSFAAQREDENEKRRRELLERLLETVRELRWLGMTDAEIAASIEKEGGNRD